MTGVNGHSHRSGPSISDGSIPSQVTVYKDTDKIGLGDKGSPKASPPPDLAFEVWVRSLEGQFASKLRELKKELRGKLAVAKSDAARAEWDALPKPDPRWRV